MTVIERLKEILDDLQDYMNERADAVIETGSPRYHPNTEMNHSLAITEALILLSKLEKERK